MGVQMRSQRHLGRKIRGLRLTTELTWAWSGMGESIDHLDYHRNYGADSTGLRRVHRTERIGIYGIWYPKQSGGILDLD